jgi:hypothetical protein
LLPLFLYASLAPFMEAMHPGKTNFFKALNFAKNLIIKGTQPDGIINVETFQLDDSAIGLISCSK